MKIATLIVSTSSIEEAVAVIEEYCYVNEVEFNYFVSNNKICAYDAYDFIITIANEISLAGINCQLNIVGNRPRRRRSI